jgi:hypothetical protein
MQHNPAAPVCLSKIASLLLAERAADAASLFGVLDKKSRSWLPVATAAITLLRLCSFLTANRTISFRPGSFHAPDAIQMR